MGERTEYSHGTHSWADLSTDDWDAAKTFYGELFGWDFDDVPTGDDEDAMLYSMAEIDGKDVCAVFKGDGSTPVHWNSYVTVDDLDSMPDKVKEAGGEVMAEPFDVMEDVGRMMVLQDPAGAFLNLWEPKENIGAQVVDEPGALAWFDLNTTDVDAAKKFYAELFGWDYDEAPESDGDYWIIKHDGRKLGGVNKMMDGDIPSHWVPYFAAGDAASAAKRVEELGGRIFFGPEDVPTGSYAVVQDPQGGIFGIYSGDSGD
jgi:uncharacterized protein